MLSITMQIDKLEVSWKFCLEPILGCVNSGPASTTRDKTVKKVTNFYDLNAHRTGYNPNQLWLCNPLISESAPPPFGNLPGQWPVANDFFYWPLHWRDLKTQP